MVNQSVRPVDGKNITAQLQTVLNRFVGAQAPAGNGANGANSGARGIRLIHMGDIPVDQAVKDAVMRRQLLLVHTPGSPAALAMGQLAGRVEETIVTPSQG